MAKSIKAILIKLDLDICQSLNSINRKPEDFKIVNTDCYEKLLKNEYLN